MLCKSKIVNMMNSRIYKCKGVNADNFIHWFGGKTKNMWSSIPDYQTNFPLIKSLFLSINFELYYLLVQWKTNIYWLGFALPNLVLSKPVIWLINKKKWYGKFVYTYPITSKMHILNSQISLHSKSFYQNILAHGWTNIINFLRVLQISPSFYY
jgi:hypothetical protein